MSSDEELRLMARVARLYYQRGMGQSEIAGHLALSQATVSRLLQRAQNQRIVQITINPPRGFNADLEEAIERKFGIGQALVVDVSEDDGEEEIERALGEAAAFYLETTLRRGEIIGLSSWSSTLLAMVDAMRPLPRALDTQVVQILGGLGNPSAEVHAVRLTERFANLIHGQATFLSAPGVVGSEEARQVMLKDPFVAEATALFDHVGVALVGIGALEPSKLLAASGNRFSAGELQVLKSRGAVGDICLRFYDSAGAPVLTPLDQRVISMSLQQLRKVKRSIGIAGGQRKTAAIRGALAGGWVSVLITDRLVAQKLIGEEL